jgi:betaine-aldehyde dehydrogenase
MSGSVLGHFIGGQTVLPADSETFENIDPATGALICRVAQAGSAEVDAAVASAQAGFAVWSAMSGAERGRVLNRAAQLLRERNRAIAEVEVQDSGSRCAFRRGLHRVLRGCSRCHPRRTPHAERRLRLHAS